MTENHEKLVSQITQAAREAGDMILHASRENTQIFTKEGRANYVTAWDEKIQEFLISRFREILPEAHFVGEEEGQEVFSAGFEQGYTFVIDPIDGTTNFMKGYGCSVTSIALLRDGLPFIGVVYNPYTDQMFTALRGHGAYENGSRLMPCPDPLEKSLVNMGTAPYYEEQITRQAFETGHWYMRRGLDIRRSGSAAYDLCLVASGRTGLFFEPILSLWDYAAGALIVEEAGGRVTDLVGERLAYRGKSSVCAVTEGVSGENYLPPRQQTETDYALLISQVSELARTEPDAVSLMANAAAMIMAGMDRINWAGFYLVKDGMLKVGPFQGKPACVLISKGRGVCGSAWERNETIVAADVHAFPGHIACDSASRSEIVVPIHAEKEVAAVLDIDSPVPDRFSEKDREGLEQLVTVLEKAMKW